MRDAQDADVLADQANRPEERQVEAGPEPAVWTASAATGRGGSTHPAAPNLRRSLVAALVVVALDQLTKWWALGRLSSGGCQDPGACVELLAGVRLRLVFNTGAAFTTGSGHGPALAVLAMVMTVVLLTMAARRRDRTGALLLGAVAGGAVGNLTDRIFRADDGLFSGAVVDFIDLGWWPVFNLADTAIVLGVVAILVLAFFDDRSDGAETVAPEPDTGSRTGPATPDGPIG